MRILKTSDIIQNEIIQHDGIQIFNYVSGKQIKELCEAVANVICDGNTYAIKMSKEERENLPYLSGMKVSREIHIDSLVTCGECKHFHYDKPYVIQGMPILGHEVCDFWGDGCKTNPNGFCSYGERRE